MSTSEAFNFKKINEQGATSGLLSQDHLNALGREGYRAVINLLPQWHDYAVQDEQAIVEAQDKTFELAYRLAANAPAPVRWLRPARKRRSC